jgi:hypothetical protein
MRKISKTKISKMIAKERGEHPTLRLQTIERIVKDHLRTKRR